MIIESVREAQRQGAAEEHYRPASLVVLRTPLFPVETYKATFALPHLTQSRLSEVMANPKFQEMLGIASAMRVLLSNC